MISHQLYQERGRWIKLEPVIKFFNAVLFILIDLEERKMVYYPRQNFATYEFQRLFYCKLRKLFKLYFKCDDISVRISIPVLEKDDQRAIEHEIWSDNCWPCSLSDDTNLTMHYRIVPMDDPEDLKAFDPVDKVIINNLEDQSAMHHLYQTTRNKNHKSWSKQKRERRGKKQHRDRGKKLLAPLSSLILS